jgi:putative transcriptional regulator
MISAHPTPNRHPVGDEFLVDYAAGTAPEPIAVLVATHVALNPGSRRTLAQLEAAGGALLEDIAPTPVAADAFVRLLDRLGPQDGARPKTNIGSGLPGPLRAYLPDGPEALSWTSVARGISEAVVPCGETSEYKLSLLRIEPNRSIPRHTHNGPELVLVLEGGFSDEHGHYLRGDVCVADETVKHRPVADPDGDCLCLSVTRGPIRFTGILGAILNRFVPG